MKNLIATALLSVALPVLANAQQANVSRTDLSVSGYNTTSSPSSAVSGANYYQNDGATLLVMRNTSNSAITATIANQVSTINVPGYGLISLSPSVVSIPSNSTYIAGPFPKNRWNDATYDTLAVTYSAYQYISTTALRIPQ